MQKSVLFRYKYAMSDGCVFTKSSRCAMIFRYEKARKIASFDDRKTPLRCLLDGVMMLTFFDAVVIAIATCSHRDSNMMLSTCVHVVIKLATCCQFEVLSSGVNQLRGESAYLCKKRSCRPRTAENSNRPVALSGKMAFFCKEKKRLSP